MDRDKQRVWLVTGASSGFGQAIASAAADAGDVVVTTARRPEALDELAAGRPDQIEAVALDVTVPVRRSGSSARWSTATDGSTCWSTTPAAARSGPSRRPPTPSSETSSSSICSDPPHWCVRCCRECGNAGLARSCRCPPTAGRSRCRASRPTAPPSSPWRASEALAAEVGPLGIQVLVVEPGAFRTGFSGKGLVQSQRMDAYHSTVGATREMITGIDGTQPGDPARAATAILKALDAAPTPLRLPLGSDSVDGILDHLGSVEKEIRSWEPTSRGTDFA